VETPVNVNLRFYIVWGFDFCVPNQDFKCSCKVSLGSMLTPIVHKKKKILYRNVPKISSKQHFNFPSRNKNLNFPPVWGLWSYFNLVLTACNPGVWYKLQWVLYPHVLNCSFASVCTKETVWKGSWNEMYLIEGYIGILNHTSTLFWLQFMHMFLVATNVNIWNCSHSIYAYFSKKYVR
jgi:hypothetical protein